MAQKDNNTSGYRQILKSTSLFGGVQIFSIIVSIIRSKTIAVWLGPVGVGIFSIFNSFISLIGSIVNLGLGTSAVKNVSSAHASKDENAISKTVSIFRVLTVATGLLGFSVTIILSKYLSELNFKNSEYTLSFILISIVVLLNQLQQGRYVILQGTQRLKQLASASIVGTFIGLIVNIPMFYIWREQAIVPSIILSSAFSFLIAIYYTRNVNISRVKVTLQHIKGEGSEMIKMGLVISFAGLITQLSSYAIRLYIANIGDIIDLGLYSSGFTLVSTYFGMVFTAMGTDYFPRLSRVSNDNKSAFEEMNRQGEVAILIIAPLLCVFLIFVNVVIHLLLSTEFLPIIIMVKWAVLGVFFQAVSWSISFIFSAKGHYKKFLIHEMLAISYFFIINIALYYKLGLTGLGIGFMLQYLIYTLHMIIISRKFYQFRLTQKALKIIGIQLIFVLICFGFSFLPMLYMYISGIAVILISSVYSFYHLNKAIGLKQFLISKFSKK